MITDIGIGINSPIGMVIQQQENRDFSQQQNNQRLSQWMIHIGGLQNDNYSAGISFPFYIFAFGLLGGYLRYLYKTYEKGEHTESQRNKKRKYFGDEDNHLGDEDNHFLHITLAELTGILISPLLAVAVYFILFQANPSTDPYIAAAISFTLGLITKEVINSLINFAKGRVSSESE